MTTDVVSAAIPVFLFICQCSVTLDEKCLTVGVDADGTEFVSAEDVVCEVTDAIQNSRVRMTVFIEGSAADHECADSGPRPGLRHAAHLVFRCYHQPRLASDAGRQDLGSAGGQ